MTTPDIHAEDICTHLIDNEWHLKRCACKFWHINKDKAGFSDLEGFPVEARLIQEDSRNERDGIVE